MLTETIQTADWKSEKHVPVIDAPDTIKKGETVRVSVVVGKEIPHPNTTAHHIASVALYFLPDGEKFPVEIFSIGYAAHGASAQGVDTSTVYTKPEVAVAFSTEKSGTLCALAHCNIHGLWQSSKHVAIN